MKDTTLWVGMDVHKESISVSVIAGPSQRRAAHGDDCEPRSLDVRRLFTRLAKEGEVRACYEAGCCGYELHRQLAGMSIRCEVIAPSLIPVRAGDRVKTDRRDAQKLARLYRAGELTAIGIPTPAQEALRDWSVVVKICAKRCASASNCSSFCCVTVASSPTARRTGRSSTGPG